MLDLKGKMLQVATNNLAPFIFLENKPIDGTEAKILITMSELFNFTYKITDFEFNFGELLPNNTWNGLVGSIVSEQSDFGIFDLYITYDRSQVVNYTYPYFIDLVTFATPLPKIRTNNVSLLQPFDLSIWILLVFNTLIILVMSFFLFKNESHMFWTIISIFMKQQIHLHSEIRRLLFGWLLAGVVLTSSYAGVIYSILASIVEEDRIETLQELSNAQKSGKITVFGLDKGIYYNMIRETKSGVIGEIGSMIKSAPKLLDAMELLKSPKPYAFVLAKELLCYAIHKYGVSSHYIPDNSNMDSVFAINFVGIPMSKNFPHKKEFNDFISHAFKAGLFDYWRRTFYYRIFGKDMNYFNDILVNIPEINPIVIQQLGRIYMIWLCGCILSAVFLLFEIKEVNLERSISFGFAKLFKTTLTFSNI